MPIENIRILSDLHYGDRISRVRSLASLRPLLAGAGRIVFNGDSIETRPGHGLRPPAALRRQFLDFMQREAPGSVLLTGNHDADISDVHYLDLLGGLMFVTHGEIIFDDLAPWSPEQPELRKSYHRHLEALDPRERVSLEARLDACKKASAQLPWSRRRPPRAGWRRVVRIFWPPGRTLGMIRAWRQLPDRAAEMVRRHRPDARFAVVGHTHLPGIWIRRNVVVINTGSFCPPFGGYAIDVLPDQVVVRRIRRRQGEFHPGRVVARFALAPAGREAPNFSTLAPGFAPSP